MADNPAARLVRALDGVRVEGPGGAAPIVGRVMPVSWRGCVEVTAALADALAPRAILGVGVARARAGACVERVGRRFVDPATPDVDGVCLGDLDSEGPAERRASLPEGFAAALDAQDSDDAGTYVCNAWLWHALQDELPAAFLHVPDQGVEPAVLLAGIARMVASFRTRG